VTINQVALPSRADHLFSVLQVVTGLQKFNKQERIQTCLHAGRTLTLYNQKYAI